MLDDDDERPLDPQAARAVAQVRRLMMIASATTFMAVAIVVGVIGYRVFRVGGSAAAAPDATAAFPVGAKVISSAVGDGRIVLTVEIGGVTELRIFDLTTLKPLGKVRLSPQP
jgi:heme/copper-type cytochrome/quinol oxidase subunit 2